VTNERKSMKENSFKSVQKKIHLLDNIIEKLLMKKNVDENKIQILSSVRFEYMEELNNLIKVKNMTDMFKRKNKYYGK